VSQRDSEGAGRVHRLCRFVLMHRVGKIWQGSCMLHFSSISIVMSSINIVMSSNNFKYKDVWFIPLYVLYHVISCPTGFLNLENVCLDTKIMCLG